jgi:hypothetical protein
MCIYLIGDLYYVSVSPQNINNSTQPPVTKTTTMPKTRKKGTSNSKETKPLHYAQVVIQCNMLGSVTELELQQHTMSTRDVLLFTQPLLDLLWACLGTKHRFLDLLG